MCIKNSEFNFTWFVPLFQIPAEKPGDGPEKKITRLAIGVEGGFDPEVGTKFKYEEFYNIVLLPSFTQIQWPNVELPEIVNCFLNI